MASRGVNKAIIVGNLGNDPETRYLPNGTAVTTISVATSESWTDKNTGQPQERTEWHRIEAFGRLAEIMGQYLRKGSQVYIEGSIRTDKWQDQNGQDRYSTKIRADNMQMLGGRPEGQSGGTGNWEQKTGGQPSNNPNPPGAATQPAGNKTDSNETFKTPEIDAADNFDDDIPF